LVQNAITQIAPALENARLLEEIQQRAHQESLVAQFATRVQTSLDLESVLRTAVNEIGAVWSFTGPYSIKYGQQKAGDKGMALNLRTRQLLIILGLTLVSILLSVSSR